MDLLERAVKALKAGRKGRTGRTAAPRRPRSTCACRPCCPTTTSPDVHMRLVLYKRIAARPDDAATRELQSRK